MTRAVGAAVNIDDAADICYAFTPARGERPVNPPEHTDSDADRRADAIDAMSAQELGRVITAMCRADVQMCRYFKERMHELNTTGDLEGHL